MELVNYKEQLEFKGKGGEYFGIVVVNWLLTLVTLGFYYPWAKAKQLKYLYGETSLRNDPFAFHGTGKEMFVGFIKAIVVFGLLYGLFFLFIYLGMPSIAILVLYAGLIAILPIAIHGSYRYRMSRTSWRGIRFGYRGNRVEFTKKFFKWVFFTIITFGFYGAWFAINVRNYVLSNIRFGNLKVQYKGNGGDFFVMNLIGYLLSIVTFGIYSFWWQKNLFAYYVDNLSVEDGERKIKLKSLATGGDFFALLIVNMLIIVFTFGLGYAWVVCRTMHFIFNKIELTGDIDLNRISQTEDKFTDATGEDIGDFLDLDLII
ncbi:MAG: DUF898 domain-containing protein [Flavobacteriales bacterium]|nr:DUF898 domain-containing protein [Flavobacteriales bacterium]